MKYLSIIFDYFDIDKHYKTRDDDFLAVTPGAILSCKKANKRYKTLDDFYHYKDFRKDFLELLPKLEEYFSQLNRNAVINGFDKVYSSNFYWFVTFIANIVYLDKVAERIKESYEGVTFRLSAIPHKFRTDYPSLEISSASLNFNQFSFGLDNKERLLHYFLRDHGSIIAIVKPKRPGIMYKSFLDFKKIWYNKKKITKNGKGKEVWVVQDGYEISQLKKYFNCVNPLDKIEKIDLNIYSISISALKEDFPTELSEKGYEAVYGMLLSYQEDVITKMEVLIDYCSGYMDYSKPKALFYSVGANRMHEYLLAWLANRKNIPVFYFQHGGGVEFGVDPLQKWFEETPGLTYKKMSYKQFGSSVLKKNLYKEQWISNKILYCPGSPAFHAYKDLLLNVSDREQYKKHKDIVKLCKKRGLELHINLHPTEQEHMYTYFKKLCKGTGTKIIYGIPAEKILHKYGLIIVDFLTSGLTGTILSRKVPVIYYAKDSAEVNLEFLDIFIKRVYWAKSKSNLDAYLLQYKNKWLSKKTGRVWIKSRYYTYNIAENEDGSLMFTDNYEPEKEMVNFINANT